MPVAAAVAALLLVSALVGGAVLRASTAGAEVVDVGPRPARGTAGAGVGAGDGASGAAPSTASPGVGTGTDAAGVAGPGPAASGTATASGAGAVVVVDVVGTVRRPGLVRLPGGSRVADAVAAAGGATDAAALPRINLARLLVDGEQVLVPDRDDPLPAPPVAIGGAAPGAAPAGAAGSTSTAAASGPLDLNAATAADLDALPGVGPVISGRIVAWRSGHQRFSRVDELAEVEGIGPKLLERLRPLVRV